MPVDVQVLEQPAAAAALDPRRAEILAMLAEPGSATTVAQALGLPRQQVNYHLRLLQEHGLVELVEERPRRGLTERVVRATARGYVVSPSALGPSGADPERTDRLSSRYLLAVAARLISEVGRLASRAEASGHELATLTVDTEIRFASAADRAAFTAELGDAITTLVSRYHDESASGGRWHRLVVAAHPRPAHPRPARESPSLESTSRPSPTGDRP
jgi:DNA-binding transcriptional ArsR family regulator